MAHQAEIGPAAAALSDAAERDLRVELAAAYRMFDFFGWTELIYGHLTVRLPGPERHFLINPFGLMFHEVTASNLVKIDIDGNIVDGSEQPADPAGFVIHGARHDALCVMHSHSRAGWAIAALSGGLNRSDFGGIALDGAARRVLSGLIMVLLKRNSCFTASSRRSKLAIRLPNGWADVSTIGADILRGVR